MSALAGPVPSLDSTKPPGAEIGAPVQNPGGLNGWASFVDDAEFVPELSWPQSTRTYHKMRSDSQIEALHVGTVQPIREFRWSIDPNGAPATLAEQAAADLGLPILGHEDDPIQRGPRMFSFDAFLDDALLAPLYGFMHHEIVGSVRDGGWHIDKLSPRHPRTIMQFQTNDTGELTGIQQVFAGGVGGWNRLPPVIPANKLVTFVWRPEAGSHVGRALLRSIYREWMVKDRTIRVAAINLERGGGIPAIEGPMGASDKQLQDLAQLARQFKVAEGGGGAIPFGSKLTLVGGHVPDAISLLKYCDDCMARVWALMLVQLGMTSTGNRALGAEFAIYAARAQRTFAKWVKQSVDRLLDDYTEWNLGPSASHAPQIHFESAKPDGLSLADMVALIEAGALNVDPELEDWIRSEGGLPPAPPAPTAPELGDLSPEEVALVQNSRNPPVLPAGPPTSKLPTSLNEPQVNAPTFAAHRQTATARELIRANIQLPDRPLRRQPYKQEIRAAVNYRALDQAHAMTVAGIDTVFRSQILPGQIRAIGEQIVTGPGGKPRKQATKKAMSAIKAPVAGVDEIHGHLVDAARQGANAALAELAAQGVTASQPADAALAARLADQAGAVATLAASGLTTAAQRRASSLVGGGRTPDQIRAQVEQGLSDMTHSWTTDQLQGAVTYAQNVGRAETFATAPQAAISYYASEILDNVTCTECIAVDGTQYQDLQAAEQDYAAGGYVNCLGGPRCRGTLVAVSGETPADYGQGIVDPGATITDYGA